MDALEGRNEAYRQESTVNRKQEVTYLLACLTLDIYN